jgi:glutamate dehydrogenase
VAGLQKAIAQLMEGRQERPAERTDPAALVQLFDLLRERVAPSERSRAEAFARELFGKAHALLAETGDLGSLAAMTTGAFAFLRDRGRSPIAVRLFTPRPERDGWASPLTVVETIIEDRPFIVETVCEALAARGGELRLLLHPVLGVERSPDGRLIRVGAADSAESHESFLHAELAELQPDSTLQQQLTDRLRQLLNVTGDYAAMRARVDAIAADLRAQVVPPAWDVDRDELAALLDWLGRKSFVYLGYREYDVRGAADARQAVVRPGSGLGLLRDDERSSYRSARALAPALARRLDQPPLWLVSKTRAVSPVHRSAPMDDLVVKELEAVGAVVGVRRLIGLFTAKADADAASELPILRRRIATILADEGAVADSHDGRDLVALFNSVPRDELFASDLADIHALMTAIRAADVHAGMRLLCRPDALQRGVFAVVLVPRARFSTELHARISAVLRQQLGPLLHEHLALDERPVARLHYHCAAAPEVLAHPPIAAVQEALDALLRTWDDELCEVLARSTSRAAAERLAARYARALPAAYKASTAVDDAARDIGCLEALSSSGRAQIQLAAAGAAETPPYALRLYLANESLVLSDFVPVLENLGLRVLGQHVVEVKLPEVQSACIHTFAVAPAAAADAMAAAARLVDAVHAWRAGAVENDHLNTLVLNADLDWRAVDLLRAYVAHAAQVPLAGRQTLIESLTANPASAASLFHYFASKFDAGASPLAAAQRAAGPVAEARARYLASLDAVQSLAHDRLLRDLGDSVGATVRSNFFTAPTGAAIALKFDAARLPQLPDPRPAFETWVHGPWMDGVHLRAGRVARGGIRSSDRPDDFRAEILGLMRTQVVKNALIVPVGAKGGFVLSAQPAAGTPTPARIEAAYRLFIEALLSVTDNLVHGQTLPPSGQIVYDEPDPYLVVAADKGTATLSDTANEIAAARGYWLGDAFASGGRHGYDHKRLGITARGAWECARQHFRELGRDLERETITVAGIGDMSGDVFGNGLLRSRDVRLLAAFNHRDIFLDPDPDPELSFRERERLFRLPRSGWDDYAPASLSRGGGVYRRSAKAIALAPEARTLLGLEAAAPSGETVVQAILRLPVDLFWNGGIGTYVKASDERHVEVADAANDAVRIDASELRAAVIVEGGNLGLTQRARIEYALGGGRINTDAIDNSAGVALSDHEVNLKIALQPPLAEGELAADARNRLLAELADPVCEAVLACTRDQALALSRDQFRSRTRLAPFRDLISILEAEAGLDRQLAHLPTRETLRARRGAFLGLTRPELAVLMAHTKLDLQHRIVQSPLCDEPELEAYLCSYFPSGLLERFAAAVRRHPLRREIIAVALANHLVDSMGMTFLVNAVHDIGHDVLEVVRAWSAAREIIGAGAVRAEIVAARGRLTADAEQRAVLALAAAHERAALWLVQRQPTAVPLAELIAHFREPVTTLLASWPERLTPGGRSAHAAAVATLSGSGLDASLAQRLVCLDRVDEALEISHLARAASVPLPVAAEAYVQTEALLDLEWIRRVLPGTLTGEDRWEPRARASLLEAVRDMHRHLTLQVLAHRHGGEPITECLRAYALASREQLDVVNGLISDLKAAPQPTLPALLVLLRELARLARPIERGKAW